MTLAGSFREKPTIEAVDGVVESSSIHYGISHYRGFSETGTQRAGQSGIFPPQNGKKKKFSEYSDSRNEKEHSGNLSS